MVLRDGQAHQAGSGNDEVRFPALGDSDDAAPACERGGYVKVVFPVEGHPLGPSQPAVEIRNFSLGRNPEDTVETRRRRAGQVKVSARAEGQMIGGHARLERRKNEDIPPTGISFDRAGQMYVSSRFEGNVYQVSPSGERSVYADGMGVATGIAFDEDENLYVGDRSGTVFKIDHERNIFVFATLEPSMAAYHLAFGPSGYLYLTSPTTSSYDFVFRISPKGEVSEFYRGLGRPQGMAFDREDNLYVAASLGGHVDVCLQPIRRKRVPGFSLGRAKRVRRRYGCGDRHCLR